jgi:N-dimethylarginine dimethylaminohydrolase
VADTRPTKRRSARLSGAARAEGGDFIWLDERIMLGGRSYRTNAEGLRQLARILAAEGARLEQVDLPHDRGPGRVHLMSLISLVADDLAVIYPPPAPAALMETLAERGSGWCLSPPASTRRWGGTSWLSGHGGCPC